VLPVREQTVCQQTQIGLETSSALKAHKLGMDATQNPDVAERKSTKSHR
jgi:hypothetical protein